MTEAILIIFAMFGWGKAYMYKNSLKAIVVYMQKNKFPLPSKKQIRESMKVVVSRKG